jgi:hypothetical protein
LPWVVYQVNVGMPSPTFFAFVPMRTLAQNDDLLNLRDLLHEAEGEAAERMQQIARSAYAHTERMAGYPETIHKRDSRRSEREQRSGPAHFLELDFWPGIVSA